MDRPREERSCRSAVFGSGTSALSVSVVLAAVPCLVVRARTFALTFFDVGDTFFVVRLLAGGLKPFV